MTTNNNDKQQTPKFRAISAAKTDVDADADAVADADADAAAELSNLVCSFENLDLFI